MKQRYWSKLENRRDFVVELYSKLNLNSLEDWKNVTYKTIQNYGGRSALSHTHNNLKNLLIECFPNYPFQFTSTNERNINKPMKFWNNYENRKKFVDKKFSELSLTSLDDWKNFSRAELIKLEFGGLLSYYKGNVKELFTTLYPEHSWSFTPTHQRPRNHPNKYWTSIQNQQKFMEDLMKKNLITTFDALNRITTTKIRENGGSSLANYYDYDMKLLLKTLYPNYPWIFSDVIKNEDKPRGYWLSMQNQRSFLDDLYLKLKFSSMEDWVQVSSKIIKDNGGSSLLSIYKYKLKDLLSSIYPQFKWDNIKQKKKLAIRDKLLHLITEYKIQQKDDWYRVESKFITIKQLQNFYHEEWSNDLFKIRCKKSKQRKLFIALNSIYPSFYIIEDYRMIYENSKKSSGIEYPNNDQLIFELDIFIPELNKGYEYLGEHHYDDIPSGFSPIEMYKDRDIIKKDIISKHNIQLIEIPYWWNSDPKLLIS